MISIKLFKCAFITSLFINVFSSPPIVYEAVTVNVPLLLSNSSLDHQLGNFFSLSICVIFAAKENWDLVCQEGGTSVCHFWRGLTVSGNSNIQPFSGSGTPSCMFKKPQITARAARNFFFTSATVSDASFSSQHAACAAESGLPGFIENQEDYDFIADNLASGIAPYGQHIPLYDPNFTWGDGPLTLELDSPLRNGIETYGSTFGCYRLQSSMKLLHIACNLTSKKVLCYKP